MPSEHVPGTVSLLPWDPHQGRCRCGPASSSLRASALSLPGALNPWRPPRAKALHCEVRTARRSAKARSTPRTQTTKLFFLLLFADSVIHPPNKCPKTY